MGGDARSTDGIDFDLDASIFMVGENGKVRSDADFIFYNKLLSDCGAIEHTGDKRTGDGDDEAIKVFVDKVPPGVHGCSLASPFTIQKHANKTLLR